MAYPALQFLLPLYAVCNIVDQSWGTRENVVAQKASSEPSKHISLWFRTAWFWDINSHTLPRAREWVSERTNEWTQRSVRTKRANEGTDKRTAHYLRPNSRLFQTTVRSLNRTRSTCLFTCLTICLCTYMSVTLTFGEISAQRHKLVRKQTEAYFAKLVEMNKASQWSVR